MVVWAEMSPVVLPVLLAKAEVADIAELWAETPIASAAARANVEVSILIVLVGGVYVDCQTVE